MADNDVISILSMITIIVFNFYYVLIQFHLFGNVQRCTVQNWEMQ